MNPRIRDFALEATVKNIASEEWVFSDTELEKLAELLIKECARVQHKRFCEHGDVSWDILMQHFGVKE